MNADERLQEALAIGNELVGMVERYAPGTDEHAQRLRERWAALVASPASDKPDDYLEEWGESAASRTMRSAPVEDTPAPLDWQTP